MKKLALIIAIGSFFGLAAVGLSSGVSPHASGLKAAAGAVIIYIVVRVAGRLVAGIIADVLVRDMSSRRDER